MIPTLARLIKGKIAPRKAARPSPSLKDIQKIRSAMLRCLEDCDGVPVHRLRHKIERTHGAQELWLLRNDVYQLVSHQTSQVIAAERINTLPEVFEGYVDPRQLVRIR